MNELITMAREMTLYKPKETVFKNYQKKLYGDT